MAPLRLTAIRAGARAARPTWSIATNIATPTSTTTTHTGHTQATSRAPRHTLPSRLSSHPRRCLHSTCTMSLATADDCTCSCPSHGGVPDRGLSTSPFNAPPGVANQVPFHSHALVGSTTGANAYAHHQPMRGYNQATTGPMSPTGKQVGDTLRGVSTRASANSPSSTPTTSNVSSPVSAPVATPRQLPDHIHSATCGCSHASTIPSDDQLISSEEVDAGGERFLSDLQQAVSAQRSVDASLGQTESASADSPSQPAPSKLPYDDSGKWNLQSMLEHNHRFVMRKESEPYITTGLPYKRLAVVSCMDTRLTELLPLALDLKNGDAKIIKVAGAMVAHPFGSVMRSILVAVYALGAEHILVVGHHDCGMTGMDPSRLLAQAKQRGIPESTFKTLKAAGLDLDSWLSGFDNVRDSVLHSVETIRNHPLLKFEDTTVKASDSLSASAIPLPSVGGVAKMRIPKITVTGFVICPVTGRLDLVTPTDERTEALLAQQQVEREELAQRESAEADAKAKAEADDAAATAAAVAASATNNQ